MRMQRKSMNINATESPPPHSLTIQPNVAVHFTQRVLGNAPIGTDIVAVEVANSEHHFRLVQRFR